DKHTSSSNHVNKHTSSSNHVNRHTSSSNHVNKHTLATSPCCSGATIGTPQQDVPCPDFDLSLHSGLFCTGTVDPSTPLCNVYCLPAQVFGTFNTSTLDGI